MKKFTQFRVVIFLVTALALSLSCGKDGQIGPAGPKGDTGEGAPGPQGPKGETGGFTFKTFVYDNITVPAGMGKNVGLDFDVTKEEFEESLAMSYVSAGNNNDNWIPLPGPGSGGAHFYRVWYAFPTGTNKTRLVISRTEGPADGAQTFTKVKVIII